MFLKDAQQAIADLLGNDAYFTQPPAPTLLIEGQPAVRKSLQTALNGTGIALIVSKPKIKRQAGTTATVTFAVAIYENTERNAGDDGTDPALIGKRDAEDCAAKAWGILEGQNIAEGFSGLRVLGFEQVDSGEGLDIYELELSTETTIGFIQTLLESSSGETLTSDSGETIEVQPTLPP